MNAPTTQETADHAELARLAEAATPGPWKSIIDDTGGERSGWPLCIVPENGDDRSVVRTGGMWPYEWDAKVSQHEAVSTAAFIAAANPATVLALLSEIAALRGERDGLIEAAAARNSLLEITECQRDELRKALERIADEAPYRSGYCQSDVEYGPALSADEMQAVARQALANQGAE